jgi:uncharacterized protein YkwD
MAAGALIAGTVTLVEQQRADSGIEVPVAAGFASGLRQDNTAQPSTPSSTSSTSATTSSAPSVPSTRPPAPSSTPRTTSSSKAPAAVGALSGEAAKVVTLVNQARASQGSCAPLRVDDRLNTSAQRHAADMAKRRYFSHVTPESVTFAERILDAGYQRPGAENIARGQRSAQEVMNSWMTSQGHRENILNCELTTIGIGLDTNGFYWVQNFGF